MTADRPNGGPRDRQDGKRVASGRPGGAGQVTFGDAAAQLLDNGYEPIPIKPGQKAPALNRWTSVVIDEAAIEAWLVRHGSCGVGLRTGNLIGVDIDILDPDRAHEAQVLAVQRFGETLVRVGRWPKRLLLYRTETPFAKMKAGQIELLGLGQQFVAFGCHPGTGQPYSWPLGETPLEVPLSDLPVIDRTAAAAFLAEAVPASEGAARRPRSKPGTRTGGNGPVRDAGGFVADGRDDWLSRIAFHEVHDALDQGDPEDIETLTSRVWEKFCASTDLARGRGGGDRAFDRADAREKVRDKLRLAARGALPGRNGTVPEPGYDAPGISAAEGRARLDEIMEGFCKDVLGWHRGQEPDMPALGIRATVGLGKSVLSRDHILTLQNTLKANALPHRILVFTPSHALAEEAAEAWRTAGADAVVARGYERSDPVTGEPMCRDLDAVRAALASRLKVPGSACATTGGIRCTHFYACHKQSNLRDVASADAVIAPYDTLFSGLAFDKDDIALLLIDEGCWARALQVQSDLFVEAFGNEPVDGMGGDCIGRGPVGAMNDLHLFRQRLAAAMRQNGPGPLRRQSLEKAGISEDDCHAAARLERWRQQDPGLRPGLSAAERQRAFRISNDNARIEQFAAVWEAGGRYLAKGAARAGNIVIREPDANAMHGLEVRQVRQVHESLRGKPLLHLDATLRPELAQTVLPGLRVEALEVAAPHMRVRHVGGSFGKSMLCPGKELGAAESVRRANRLQECVDYVRWHARRVFPGSVLIVTYKSIEAAFTGIPNVDVAHFNAVAGLDFYKDVALLIVIGRPLPSHVDLDLRTGGYFGQLPSGGYSQMRASIRMRSGAVRSLPVLRHTDDQAETLRAAICDDELIQVVGRGRGVNRNANDPLEVHVLADVALPLVYDSLTVWDVERPDIVQRMLLAGVAVDSPADATALHPDMFSSANEAKLAFSRAAFKGQNPIYTSYREMTLKSAAYRRTGRGRSWQRVWWIEGDANAARGKLECVLGELAEWRPD